MVATTFCVYPNLPWGGSSKGEQSFCSGGPPFARETFSSLLGVGVEGGEKPPAHFSPGPPLTSLPPPLEPWLSGCLSVCH